jgi:Neocarzinostatin family
MKVRAGVAYIAAGVLLAACGSEVSPDAFLSAQASLAGNGGSLASSPSGAALTAAGPSGAAGPAAGPMDGAGSGGGSAPGGGAPRHGASASVSASGSASPGHAPNPTSTHRAAQSSSAGSTAPQACTRTATTPSVKVCPHDGLHDGQTVTVEGWGFKPNTQLAVAECRDAGQSTSLADCNINSVVTYSPGAKVTSDADGHVGPLRIIVNKAFKEVNCGTESCLIAISEPTLNPDPKDEGDVHLHFV